MSLSHWSDADRYPRSLHQLWLSLLIAAGVLREVQRCGVDGGVKAVCRFLLRKEKKPYVMSSTVFGVKASAPGRSCPYSSEPSGPWKEIKLPFGETAACLCY